jgi:hypothetical protein
MAIVGSDRAQAGHRPANSRETVREAENMVARNFWGCKQLWVMN